jgi:hypothetical protein
MWRACAWEPRQATAQSTHGSLKANTAYQDVVACGTDAPITVTFATATAAFGNTYPEAPPFDANAPFGSYAWPQCETASVQCVDPQTGVVIEPVTKPGWSGSQRGPLNFNYAIGGAGWTDPQGILSGPACAGSAGTGSTGCAQTGNTNAMFFAGGWERMEQRFYSDNARILQRRFAGYTSSQTYDDVLLQLTVLTSSSGDGVVNVCTTYNGSTCASAMQTITL